MLKCFLKDVSVRSIMINLTEFYCFLAICAQGTEVIMKKLCQGVFSYLLFCLKSPWMLGFQGSMVDGP